jgi:hypothetical protein
MNETYTRHPESALTEIRVQGHLDERWCDWFSGLTITHEENGDTLLIGSVVDQAALYGLLRKVRDLGMPLLSVNLLELGQTDVAGLNQRMNGE